jgi:hypothetical protein
MLVLILSVLSIRAPMAFFLAQRFALTRVHRSMPGGVLPGIRAFECALVTSVTKDVYPLV